MFKILYDFGTTLAPSFASDEVRTNMKLFTDYHSKGMAHCPICTHTVPADIEVVKKGKFARVTPGQRCQRCGSSLDVAIVIEAPEAQAA